MKSIWTENDFSKLFFYCGGKKNITKIESCTTRLRIHIIDLSTVEDDVLVKLPGVKSIVKLGTEVQLIIGMEAYSLNKECAKYFQQRGN